MPFFTRRAVVAALILAIVGAASVSYAAGRDRGLHTIYGPAVAVGDGTARAFVRIAGGKVPVALGVALSDGALSGLPAEPVVYELDLPAEAPAPFDHIALDWNPHGHDPEGIYTHPHFDYHFYTISRAERAAIAGGPDEVEVPAQFTPAGYFSTVESFPNMGVHWLHKDAPELHGHNFDKTMLYGFSQGRLVFLEPMITLALLESRDRVGAWIPQPAAFEREGRYPTSYTVRYDQRERAHLVVLEDLERR